MIKNFLHSKRYNGQDTNADAIKNAFTDHKNAEILKDNKIELKQETKEESKT